LGILFTGLQNNKANQIRKGPNFEMPKAKDLTLLAIYEAWKGNNFSGPGVLRALSNLNR